MEEFECKCGRVWELYDSKWPMRDPGKVICVCGQVIREWSGSRTWSAKLAKGLAEDKGKNIKPSYA